MKTVLKRVIGIVLCLIFPICAFSCAKDDPPSGIDSVNSEAVSDSSAESGDSLDNSQNDDKGNNDNGDGENENEPQPEMTTYKLNSQTEGIHILGERYLPSESQINLDWTCSGIEMNIRHEGGPIIFKASGGNTYFRVYVDGNPWMNKNGTPYYETPASDIVIENVPKGEHCLKLLKVTGYTLSRAEITSVSFAGEILPSTFEDKELYIEFIGDSISCGWGLIGNHTGAYTDQDGALAHPYLIAQALDADYAITALSGQGFSQGNPGFPLGYLYSSALRSMTPAGEYSFERKADVVVINLGSNDMVNMTDEQFEPAYRSFIQTVREKNGDNCKIICAYNTINDTHGSAIEAACETLGGEEAGIYALKLSRSSKVYNGHPTKDENVSYAETLGELINRIKDTTPKKPSVSGAGLVVNWVDGVPVTDDENN